MACGCGRARFRATKNSCLCRRGVKHAKVVKRSMKKRG